VSNVLYAMPASLYSAKARSYLRKQDIDYLERVPGDPRYLSEVIPRIGRWIIPVLVTDDGRIVQDTVDIIDHFERFGVRYPAYPPTPRHRVVAHVLELFGGEGLLRPAMHYRWNFDDTNLAFLSEDFSAALALGTDKAQRQAVFQAASGRMRRATTAFGVTEETVPEIERSYQEFLTLFADHLEHAPYLLGGRASLGDFAFMGPLSPHLARDPYPSLLMKQRAPRVWRWVERMNTTDADAGEYGDLPMKLFADDQVPPTLQNLLGYIAEEYLAEVLAYVTAIDGWLAEHPETAEGEVVGGRPDKRFLGTTSFSWRGLRLTISVVPYRLYLLQRLQAAFAEQTAEEQQKVRSLLHEVGLDPLLEVRARRRVERRDNREVWGAAQEPVLG
jgi:glutathione S-transferase